MILRSQGGLLRSSPTSFIRRNTGAWFYIQVCSVNLQSPIALTIAQTCSTHSITSSEIIDPLKLVRLTAPR